MKVPAIRDTLAERILTEEDTLKMLAMESDKRNHCLLRLLYDNSSTPSSLRYLVYR